MTRKTKETEKADEGRRGFLKLAGLSTAAAAAGAAGGEAAADTGSVRKDAGLRKTPHVEAYLASARF